jgi:uncharacterized membrane protein
MDNPSNIMKTKEIALIAMLSAATVAVAYSKGLYLSALPGVVEFMTVLIFVSGFCFGPIIGAAVGALSLLIYNLIPYPFAHPAAWLFTISPVLLAVMAALGAMFGVVGGLLGKSKRATKGRRFVLEMALWGFLLTLVYDVMSSVGFYLAYPYTSIWDTIYLTFIPLYYPYPPIVHTFVNTLVFAIVAPPTITSVKDLYAKVTT